MNKIWVDRNVPPPDSSWLWIRKLEDVKDIKETPKIISFGDPRLSILTISHVVSGIISGDLKIPAVFKISYHRAGDFVRIIGYYLKMIGWEEV